VHANIHLPHFVYLVGDTIQIRLPLTEP